MKLEIVDTNKELDIKFGRWLVKRIQQNFILKVDKNKLLKWNDFFKDNPDFTTTYKKDIQAFDILDFGVKTLICELLPDKLVIKLNNTLFVPGLDRVRVDTVCRLITFGSISIQGYPILVDILDEVANNITNYVEEYREGLI